MLDLDNFKWINDHFGHAIGDQVLKAMASVLHQNTRPGDVVGRHGGEEFEILMLDTDLTAALQYAEKIRSALEGYRLPTSTCLTASVGVAVYNYGDDIGAMRLRADSAVYAAKQGGKNRIVAADKTLDVFKAEHTRPFMHRDIPFEETGQLAR